VGVVTGPDESRAAIDGRPLIPGEATGPLLKLTHPISFWGGVDPVEGRIVDPRHPQFEASIAGTVLAIPSAVGSSSSSAIMLELIREGRAPAAILLGKADGILVLGAVVAKELGYTPVPVIEVPPAQLERLPDGVTVRVGEDGSVKIASD
jgi:predicted aconitase with swiveling domain